MTEAKSRPPRSPRLKPFVQSIWCYASAYPRSYELVMPGGGGQLILNLMEDELRHWTSTGSVGCRVGPVGLQGPLTHPVVIDTDQKRCVCGVAFQPGGLSAFHEKDATFFVDTIVDALDVMGDSAVTLREALRVISDPEERIDRIEGFLLDNLRERPEEDLLIQQLTREFRQGDTVSNVRARFGLSQRRLHGLFDRRIGIRPKLFARIERFVAGLECHA